MSKETSRILSSWTSWSWKWKHPHENGLRAECISLQWACKHKAEHPPAGPAQPSWQQLQWTQCSPWESHDLRWCLWAVAGNEAENVQREDVGLCQMANLTCKYACNRQWQYLEIPPNLIISKKGHLAKQNEWQIKPCWAIQSSLWHIYKNGVIRE